MVWCSGTNMKTDRDKKPRYVYKPLRNDHKDQVLREKREADASSPQHEAVASELQDLSLHPTSSLPPIRERSGVLQLKLQQRRTREELINQGIMPHTSAEPSLQAKQLQLKKARLADDLNVKISHRPGPMELVHKNILPVHSSIKQAIETQFPKAPGENSSCDEDSNDSLSPEQPVGQDSPLGVGPLPSLPETLAERSIPSPSQVPPSAPLLPSLSGSSPPWKQTNGAVTPSAQNIHVTSQITSLPKSSSHCSGQKHKKSKDNKPKIKKLKYHQYIPPDQKGDKEPLPHLDSSYAKILQQQQLFLQLQILSQQQQQQQQQQQYNYHTILPAPPNLQENQQPTSSSNSRTTSSPPQPLAAPSVGHSSQSLPSLDGTKPVSLPLNLDEMKVVELKSQLKLRSLPVSGTKPDLIERLRTYQELNGGSDSFSSPTAGGTTGSGSEGAGRSSQNAAAGNNNDNNNVSLQQPFQCLQTSSLTGHSATPQQLLNCSVKVSPPTPPLTLSDHPSATSSPEDTSFNSDPLSDMMRSPLSQLSLQPCSPAQLPVNIKDELACSTPAPCPFSLKPATLEKHCLASNRASTTTTTAPLLTIDKDRMLQEKDKQIQELTRMLRQSQRLVDLLRMQLEQRKRATRVSEPVLLVRVKQEPSDHPSVPLSSGHPSPHPQNVSLSSDTIFTKVNVKHEVTEAAKTMQPLDSQELQQTYPQTQETPEQIRPHAEPQKKHVRHNCLQQKTLQLVQQQAIQKLLLQQQQQQNMQNTNHVLENQQNLQRLSQQRKKKSHKQQLKQLQKHQQSKHLQQQMQLKQQILTTQQKTLLQQQQQQQQQQQHAFQPPQQIQMQTTMHLKQQQVVMQQKQKLAQQQSPQDCIKEQPGSAGCFLPLFKSDSTQALVTDSNGNHFLITLGNPVTENHRREPPEGKANGHVTLQRAQSTPAKLFGHNPAHRLSADIQQSEHRMHLDVTKQQNLKDGGLQLSADQTQQVAAQCLSAPPSIQPFFKDQESAHNSSPASPNEVCSSLDVLFSPVSPAASSPDNKDTEHEDDFIDIILQTGGISSPFKPMTNSPLDHLSQNSSPPPSPLQLLLSSPIPHGRDTPQPTPLAQPQLQTLVDTIEEERQHLSNGGSGRLEDFLESTTGKPLLGVEPGGLLTLIDDLHSQMLCTPSILDNPPSPMDTFDMVAEDEHVLDSMDWLDLTVGRESSEESPTLDPLGPQTPPSVFSTDFLDSSDLQIHWDSCL
ncbi:hypothetical protein JOB18_048044 [Solea senegalensis]|uniref:SAP domain-containing protein n=1 Tax=Solea senegalensis TaxID=28829 RepID=A0AAV6RQT5_SOLSE|nr:myocardin-related transcription factor A-like [Solea senegalensis]KAG7506161.1 hypothetical protein JOB18_048044 [Solea senegalensis]